MLPVYIAGIGTTQIDNAASDETITHKLAVSAAVKALLDAGITYDDVDCCFATFPDDKLKLSLDVFDNFGKAGASVCRIDSLYGLLAISQAIESGKRNCSLMIGLDKKKHPETKHDQIAAIAIVITSHDFLVSHPYLKDSSVLINGLSVAHPVHSRSSHSDGIAFATMRAIQGALDDASMALEAIHVVSSLPQHIYRIKHSFHELSVENERYIEPQTLISEGRVGLLGICEIVWQLRGWARDRPVSKMKNCLLLTVGHNDTAQIAILARADGCSAPSWEKVEHLRDGKERMGYNPALESKEIYLEDWRAVRSRDESVPESISRKLNLKEKGGNRAALSKL